jgi:ribosomal protein L31E
MSSTVCLPRARLSHLLDIREMRLVSQVRRVREAAAMVRGVVAKHHAVAARHHAVEE